MVNHRNKAGNTEGEEVHFLGKGKGGVCVFVFNFRLMSFYWRCILREKISSSHWQSTLCVCVCVCVCVHVCVLPFLSFYCFVVVVFCLCSQICIYVILISFHVCLLCWYVLLVYSMNCGHNSLLYVCAEISTVYLSPSSFVDPFEHLSEEETKRSVQSYLAYLKDDTRLITNPGLKVAALLYLACLLLCVCVCGCAHAHVQTHEDVYMCVWQTPSVSVVALL